MRSVLEAYYEPQFSDNSHGFRPERGCHTALRCVYCTWLGAKWFIEGDIKGCFDNIDHTILLAILREKIRDNRFLTLVENLLKAGYLEQWTQRPTLSGTPQGGIISPLLANIYLDRLDKFVERTLIPEFTRGEAKKRNSEYYRLASRIRRLRKRGTADGDLAPLRRELRRLGTVDEFDPGYRRLRYIRYADDFLLGFDGPKDEAEEIKGRLAEILRDQLKLELSKEKTLITHAVSEKARFLGYDISTYRPTGSRRVGCGHIVLRVPSEVLEAKVSRYTVGGKPTHRDELQNDDDFTIVSLYGAEYRGVVNYYAFAQNRWWLHRLHWAMELSLLKTLARKHQSSVRKMYRKYAGRTINQSGLARCLKVIVEREGKAPLVAQFGGISLRPEPFAEIEDLPLDRDRITSRNELIQRLLADECEICGSREDVQVHHIRKLADLNVEGRPERPRWMKLMAARRRKTLVLCRDCHNDVHAGRPEGIVTRTARSLESRMTGNCHVRFGGGRMEKGS